MAWWIWALFIALGAAVAYAQVHLIKRLLIKRAAKSIIIKFALWTAAAAAAVLVNPLALLALIIGSAPVYALGVYAAWKHRDD